MSATLASVEIHKWLPPANSHSFLIGKQEYIKDANQRMGVHPNRVILDPGIYREWLFNFG